MVQLDALRAFAAAGVMYFHFLAHGDVGGLPWGGWGVQLFFCLSGFLITGILLKCRESAKVDGGYGWQLRQFYIRRTLRIIPLFYFVILATALANVQPVRETIWWHLSYTSNFYFSLRGDWNGPVSHFWSLAVEEQFYLFWPFLILFVPEKHLLRAIVGAVLVAPLFQIAGHYAGLQPITITVSMIGSLGFLGTGALLAYYRFKHPEHFAALARRKSYLLAGAGLFTIVLGAALLEIKGTIPGVVLGMITALFFGWLVHKTAIGFRGIPGKLMQAKPLLYCGKISYGIYVYHLFMPWLTGRIFTKLHIPYPEHHGVQFLLLTSATIVVATCSWYFFESPINNLKRYFEYRATAPRKSPVHAAAPQED